MGQEEGRGCFREELEGWHSCHLSLALHVPLRCARFTPVSKLAGGLYRAGGCGIKGIVFENGHT